MAILGFWVFVSLVAAGAAEAVRIQLGRMLRLTDTPDVAVREPREAVLLVR